MLSIEVNSFDLFWFVKFIVSDIQLAKKKKKICSFICDESKDDEVEEEVKKKSELYSDYKIITLTSKNNRILIEAQQTKRNPPQEFHPKKKT